MNADKENSTVLDELFIQFIAELEKQPISRQKAIELERKFLLVMDKNYSIRASENSASASLKADNEIVIDMKKLMGERASFKLALIPEKAVGWASVLVYSLVGLLFITLGFFLIVTPATPEFEVATIFYFNEYDGFTVLDLFALLVIFIGIFFFIKAFVKTDKK